MRKQKRKRRWRIIRALVFGVVATLLTIYWPAIFQNIHQYPVGREILTKKAPSYLENLAPAFYTGWTLKLTGKCDGLFMPTPNFGVDAISYLYGDDPLNWDFTRDDGRLPALYITRYRFGFPMRAAYWDDYHIPPGGTIESTKAYLEQIKLRAGKHMGIEYLGRLPCDDGRRLPAMPLWTGLFFNLLFWFICWLIPGKIWRNLRNYRRKRRGLCISCGYAVEDLVVCPECGSDHAGSLEKLET